MEVPTLFKHTKIIPQLSTRCESNCTQHGKPRQHKPETKGQNVQKTSEAKRNGSDNLPGGNDMM
jgi:hypothetical protein